MSPRRRTSRSRQARIYSPCRKGFTLLEVLVALVMFGIITYALSMALNGALLAQSVSERKQDDITTVRSVFDSLTHDIEGAYASVNSPASLFIAGTNPTSDTVRQEYSGNALLTLTTLANRLQADQLTGQQDVGLLGNSAMNGSVSPPQSDCALVRYDLDPSSGMLTRTVSPVPNPQLIAQPMPGPAATLAQNVVSLTLNFWDPNAQQMRNYWDYEQPNMPQSQSNATTGTGTTGSTTGGTANSATNTTATNGDSTLPSAVQVTLIIRSSANVPMTYTTTIPIASPLPQTPPVTNPAGTNPANTTTSGSSTSGTGG